MKKRDLFFRLILPLGLLALFSGAINYWFSFDGFFINLATELIGIIITIAYVDWIVSREEEKEWSRTKRYITVKINKFLTQMYYQIIDDLQLLSRAHSCKDIWPLEIKGMVWVLENKHPTYDGMGYDNITTSPAMKNPTRLVLLKKHIEEILENCDDFTDIFGSKLNPTQYELIFEVSHTAQDVKSILDDVQRDIEEFGEIPYWFKDEGRLALVCNLDFLMFALMKVHRYWATLDGVIKSKSKTKNGG